MSLDSLGPYSIPALRSIADDVGISVEIRGSFDKAAEEALLSGKPLILLWRATPTFGHFILLHWTKPGQYHRVLELFDPLGGQDPNGSQFQNYLDDTTGLNGGGLRPWLQSLDKDGVRLDYNPKGPQAPNANSCGLWCLLRAYCPNLSPSEFRKTAKD